MRLIALSILVVFISCKPEGYRDMSFYSEAFQSDRWYRIYLPDDYDANLSMQYPVVYYFHGYGGRYKWDTYDITDDANYPENGRKEPPFVMEWKDYVKNKDVIIVTWDGYEPNQHEGKMEREGIKYGGALPYDYVRAHEEDHHYGLDFRKNFRELVKHVDDNFRTIPDRGHRGITGLSMGGLTAFYIAGQNKDLVSSVSAFDPADNHPLYGPKGSQSVFPVLEMYRPLKGLSVRLTMTDGDWLKYNDWKMKELFEATDLDFEFHLADYPNHWAADIDKQLDFHMKEFGDNNSGPKNWNHVSPAFPSFEVLDYKIDVQRNGPALTILENINPGDMKILSRKFIPDGPIVREEEVAVSTSAIYSPNMPYEMVKYNLSEEEISSHTVRATAQGKLHFELAGGGYILGINENDSNIPNLKMVFKNNQEYFYFEIGKEYTLDFNLVNIGTGLAENVTINAFSSDSALNFVENSLQIPKIGQEDFLTFEDKLAFSVNYINDSSTVGTILFEIKADGLKTDTMRLMYFVVPESLYLDDQDLLILDGNTVKDVPVYLQGPNIIEKQDLSGGIGNGNGILEKGEEVLVYIRLPKGLGENDTNTFHRTYLINHLDDPYISVKQLDYKEKQNQASTTSVSTLLTLSDDMPNGHEFDLWFRVESLYNDKDDPSSDATIYAFQHDYRRVKLNALRD